MRNKKTCITVWQNGLGVLKDICEVEGPPVSVPLFEHLEVNTAGPEVMWHCEHLGKPCPFGTTRCKGLGEKVMGRRRTDGVTREGDTITAELQVSFSSVSGWVAVKFLH